jgi:dTDP-4-amino-4,6-dideoxygalactose transaminase
MDVEPGKRILIAADLSAQDIETRMEPSGGLSLPCSTGLSEADQDKVIGACVEFLR